MRVKLLIVICIVLILRMGVDANISKLVHAEYLRRRSAHNKYTSFQILNELPTGVHAAYIRQRMGDTPTTRVNIPHQRPAKKNRQHHTSINP